MYSIDQVKHGLVFVRAALNKIPVSGAENLKLAYDSISNIDIVLSLVENGTLICKMEAGEANGCDSKNNG